MRLASNDLLTAFAGTPHTLGWLGKFALSSGATWRVASFGTTFTVDLGDGDETFSKDSSFTGASLTFRGNAEIPDGSVTAPIALTGSYTAEDVFLGVFAGMTITLFIVNYDDPADGGMQLGPYDAGEIEYDDRGRIATFEVRGILQRARQITVEELSVACRSNLGDQRVGHCRVPLYPDDRQDSTAYAVGDYIRVPAAGNYGNRMFIATTAGTTAGADPGYSYTVAATTADGTAVFTAEEAWVRSATVATVTNNGDFTLTITEPRAVDGWFELGAVKWITGNNAGTYNQVRVWTQSTSRVQTWSVAGKTVVAGDTLEIIPGCDKAATTCRTKFDNYINFRGEEYLPGRDFLNGAGR